VISKGMIEKNTIFSHFFEIWAAILNYWKIPTRFFRVDIYDTFYRGYDISGNFQLQNVELKKKNREKSGIFSGKW